MKYKKIIFVLISIINLGLPISAIAGYEVKNIEAVTEIEPIVPVVKSVTVKKLNGSSEDEQLMFATLQGMIQDILDNSKLGVVKFSVDTSSNPVKHIVEHLEIVIGGKISDTAEQPNQFSITLQEVGTKGSANFFDYTPDSPDQIYQDVKDYLTSRLNLQPIETNQSKATTEPPLDFSATALPQLISPLLLRKTQSSLSKSTKIPVDKALKLVLPEAESQPTKLPVDDIPKEPAPTKLPQPTKTIDNTPEPVPTELPTKLLPDETPKHVSPKAEIQLKSMSPTVKSISVKLQGTKREQDVLNSLQDMVNKIVDSSKLGVYRVPVPDEPLPSPVLKVYENLEIVIGAKSPVEEGLPYKVSITLQEKDSQEGVPKYFKYKQDDFENFFNILKAYLTKQLNLQPESEEPQNLEVQE